MEEMTQSSRGIVADEELSVDSNGPSSSSLLVDKLLTREEECTLKTALAFVVIKTRAAKKRRPNAFQPSSVLDSFFSPNRLPSLDCGTGEMSHIDYMFGAAKTLSEAFLLKTNESTQKALAGATGHLAHQLQVLLTVEIPSRKTARESPPSSIESVLLVSESQEILSEGNPSKNRLSPSEWKDASSLEESREALVQAWIRSSLLQQQESHRKTKKTIQGNLLASFHVYTVMIPQMATISPPLIGHIFRVVAQVIKDLYYDQIRIELNDDTIGIPSNYVDCLATSTLKLLDLCWTTEVLSSDNETHRRFLLLSLQEILGDLLIPLSQSDLAREYHLLVEASSRYYTRNETTTPSLLPCTDLLLLPPEAKLLLRVSIYRMMLSEAQ